MDDLFGDASLFAEFEKDREADSSFIRYDENADRSRIVFEGFDESEDEESDIEWTEEHVVIDKVSIKPEIPETAKNDEVSEVKIEEDDCTKEDDQVGEKTETSEKQDGEEVVMDVSKIKEETIDDPQPELNLDNKSKSMTSTSDEAKNQPTVNPQPLNGNLSSAKTSSVKSKKVKDVIPVKMLDEDDTAWLYEHLYRDEKITRPKQDMKQLINERNKYHRYSKILDSTRYVPDEQSPAVQMIFSNTAFSRKYRQQIEQFVKGLLWQEFNSNNPETTTDIDIKPGVPTCVEINEKLRPDQKMEKMRRNHAILGSSQFHKQFLIDFLGWPFTIAEPPRCNINWEIPLYGQVFDEVYADTSSNRIKTDKNKKKQKPSCWNCGHDDHSVAQCRLPRNPQRIAQNRKEFMEQQQQKTQPKFTGASRYHLDPDIASKYNKFRPGVVSDELRDALGLKDDQLPQHIYKMRLFGYPPGWLHEAKQVVSGVSIYGKQGKGVRIESEQQNGFVTLGNGEQLEDGELNEPTSSDRSEYDVNRIVEYPGFTIPTPLGIIDEHATYKMPPIQQHQLKKTLVTQSEEKAAAKKRKREKQVEEQKKEEVKKPRIEVKEDDEVKEENGDNESENKDESEKNSEDKEKMESEKEKMESEKEIDDEATDDESTTTKNTEAETPTIGSETPKQTSRPSSTVSLSKDFGTPILVRHKNSLPDASKFAVGAEDHIPFENLPEATGTFEKMKNILDLIKKKNKK